MKKLPLLISLILFFGNLQSQITAEFSTQSFNSCGGSSSPVTVDFIDQSTSPGNPITDWVWDFNDGSTSEQSSPTHTYLISGNFTICLTVTNSAGESDTECKTDYISISAIPICTILPPDELSCSNTTVTLDGSLSSVGPNFEYIWSTTNGNIVSGSTTPNAIVDSPGSYTLEVTNTVSGCSSNTTVEVTSDTNIPIADAGPDMVLSCNDVTVTLDGSGSSAGVAISYEWVDENGSTIDLSLDPTVSSPGLFTLIVTNNDNGCTASDQVTVSADTNLPSTSITTTPVCSNGMVMIDLAAPCLNCSVEILDGMGNVVCTNLPCEIDPDDGPFQITVTDLNNGCQSIENFNASISNPLTLTQTTITDATCFGGNDGAIDIDIAGGSTPYFFTWSNGSTTEDQSGLSPGIYTVSIIDINGCEIVENFEVLEPAPIQITNVVVTNISCAGINDGNIEITVDGGTAPYSYNWSNGGFPSNGLAPGTYNVTITDTNGCIFVSPDYEIIQNVCFEFSNDTTICAGEIVSLSDETSMVDFNYSWSPTTGINDPNIPNPTASPSETTTYFLTITDGSGTVVFNAAGPTVTVQNYLDFGLLDFSNAPLCEGDSLKLYGNLGLSFLWTGPSGFLSTEMDPVIPNVTESLGGTYSLTMTDEFGCTASADVDVFIDNDCVWPGDTDTNMVVNHFDLLNIGLAYDSVGTTRENASFDWFGQPSFDWSQTTPSANVNYKHIDTDGNGIIEAADTMAITQNFGLTHNFSDPDILNQFTDLPPSDGFSVVTPFYVEPDTLIEGETIALDIILGDVSNVVVGLYGIGFSIEYDSSVIVSGSASINFDNCWLGDVDADAISIQFDFHSPGRIDAAITRIDGMEMDGYGLFGEFIITLEDDILLWDGNGSNNFGGTTNDVFADFAITNYHLINFSQEEILVEGMTTIAPIEETTSLSSIELNELISVFPNPANDAFFIASQKIDIERVRIFSTTGELKSVKTKTGNNLEFSTEELASGIYFIEIQTREGIVTKKLSIVK
ncbi:MAG: PKD domain-containing protein [Saprospiraceae bacterium]